MENLTALQIVEIRKIEDAIIMAARNGNFKEMMEGYKKIAEIHK